MDHREYVITKDSWVTLVRGSGGTGIDGMVGGGQVRNDGNLYSSFEAQVDASRNGTERVDSDGGTL